MFSRHRWTVLFSTCLAAVLLLVILLMREPSQDNVGRCPSEGFKDSLNFISPAQLGVKRWQIGDYAHYRHQRKQSATSNAFNREVGFHIIAELEKSGSHGFWMRKTGFNPNRNIPKDIYRYVTVHDLRITGKKSTI